MKVNVIYKTYLNKRNKKTGHFFKRIVKVCNADENEYIQVALLRNINKNPNARYSLGHVKEEELENTYKKGE